MDPAEDRGAHDLRAGLQAMWVGPGLDREALGWLLYVPLDPGER